MWSLAHKITNVVNTAHLFLPYNCQLSAEYFDALHLRVMMMVMGMRTGGLRRDDGIQGMVEQKDGNWDIGGPLILTGSTVCSLISSHISTPHLWGIAVSISLPIKSHFCRFLWQWWELRYWRSIELDRTSAIACVGFVKDWYQEYLNLSAKKIHIFLFATKSYVAKKASGLFHQSHRKQFRWLDNKYSDQQWSEWIY